MAMVRQNSQFRFPMYTAALLLFGGLRGSKVQGLGFRFRFQGLGFRVQGLGLSDFFGYWVEVHLRVS